MAGFEFRFANGVKLELELGLVSEFGCMAGCWYELAVLSSGLTMPAVVWGSSLRA